MLKLSDLPVDRNGIIQGIWRLVHQDPNYAGGLGPIHVRDGLALVPVAGRMLRSIVGEYGPKLFAEPWTGPLPSGWSPPELVKPVTDDAQLAKLERAPWRDRAADATMPLTLELLKVGGEEAVADFARTIEEIPKLVGLEAVRARAHFRDTAEEKRAEFPEIAKAMDGFVAQLTATVDAAGGVEQILADAPAAPPVLDEAGVGEADAADAQRTPAPETTVEPSDDALPPVLEPTPAETATTEPQRTRRRAPK